MTATPMRRRMNSSTVAVVAAIAVGVSVSSAMIMRTSSAAFSATTNNTANAWTTGSVTLVDDDLGVARFSLADDGLLRGDQVLTKCIAVTYTGSLTSGVGVKFRALDTTGNPAPLQNLAPNLQVKVERSRGGSFADCTGFNAGAATTVLNSRLSADTTMTNYATSVDPWTPISNNDTWTYKFTVTVDPDGTNTAAQNATATADFTWEAVA